MKTTKNTKKRGFSLPQILAAVAITTVLGGGTLWAIGEVVSASRDKAGAGNATEMTQFISRAKDGGCTIGGSYSAGDASTPGTVPTDSVANLVGAMKGGVYSDFGRLVNTFPGKDLTVGSYTIDTSVTPPKVTFTPGKQP